MFKRLEEIIKKLQGNVLVIGIDDELLDSFKTNNYVTLYSITSEVKSSRKHSSKRKINNEGKPVSIKKLRKYINKKSVDYIILNMEEVMNYYKYVIRDTIYLNKGTIYIYSSNNIDKNFVINKYNRYGVKISVNEYKNGYLITIDNSNTKCNFFKEILYFISDTLFNIAEFIGNILIS